MELKPGQKAPAFKLPTDTGEILSLADLKGKKIILYFYPKDDTSGCTKEACGFRDEWNQFRKLKTEVIGISKDSVASHQKFKKKYDFPFTLLSDEEVKMCEAYGVWVDKSMYGKKYKGIERSTFLIDEEGKIQHIWHKVKVDEHIEDVLSRIKNL